MANCKDCFFYSEEQDTFRREYNDTVVVGEDIDNQHFCDAFSPIPKGVFNGSKDCPNYLPK